MENLNVQKIAVLRANALGDFVFTLPALHALRERFTQADIWLLGKQMYQPFLSRRSLPFDRFVAVPPYPGVGEDEDFKPDSDQVRRFFERMKREEFDLAIQVHGGGRNSNPFLKKLGARRTLGLQTPDAAALDISVPYIYYQNERLRLLEVVREVGAETKHLDPPLEVVPEDIQEAEEAVGPFGEDRQMIILHPGASDPRRRWPAEKFADVGDYFSFKGYEVGITGTPPERALVEEVIGHMNGEARNLCGQLSISGLTGLISKADLLVSNDTGPFHIAEAVRTPVVGIYWCGNMINAGPIRRKLVRPLISWQIQCPLCGHNCASGYAFDKREQKECRHLASFVSEIKVNQVTQSGEELLEIQKREGYEKGYHTQLRLTKNNGI